MTLSKTKIKFCGFTNLEDVKKALKLDVDYLGFVLVKNTPRYIDPMDVVNIINSVKETKNQAKFVAVLQNPSEKEVEKLLKLEMFDVIQFHGEETVDFLNKWKDKVEIWKVFSLNEDDTTLAKKIEEYKNVADKFLLDLPKNEQNNSFQALKTFEELNKKHNLILAGGLNPDNLDYYLKKLNPKIIDLARGVEKEPGKKDSEKMKKVIKTLKKD